MGGVASTIIIIVVMVLLLISSVGLQFFRVSRSPMGKVVRVCNNIKFDEKLSREFGYNNRIRRFKTGAWSKHKEAVSFLPEELFAELSELFYKISQINDRIDAAIKFKSDSYMASIEADRLTGPIIECRDKLQAWVYENMNNPEYLPKKRSIFRLRW